MKINIYPDPVLRQKAKPLTKSEIKELKDFLPEFIHTMEEKDGVGLACPQVGKNIKLFVAKVHDQVYVFINPQILFKSWRKNIMEEGCLSIPDVYGLVKRPERVLITYLNEHGKRKILHADELLARVIQHEYDHLFGKLFIDLTYKITTGQEKLDKMLQGHE